MSGGLAFVSYALAALSGICFVAGIAVLSGGKEQQMDNFESVVTIIDYTLNSKRKRHIVGGILLSVSLMFGGLALTAMTLRTEGDKEDE